MNEREPRTGKPTPQCLAMILCDQIITEQDTGKHTIVGSFSHISTPSVPAVHPVLWVFVSLTEGRGQYDGQIRLVHAETEQTIFQAEGPLVFDNPLQVVEVAIRTPPLLLPHAGRYDFELHVDGMLVASRRFLVETLQERAT